MYLMIIIITPFKIVLTHIPMISSVIMISKFHFELIFYNIICIDNTDKVFIT